MKNYKKITLIILVISIVAVSGCLNSLDGIFGPSEEEVDPEPEPDSEPDDTIENGEDDTDTENGAMREIFMEGIIEEEGVDWREYGECAYDYLIDEYGEDTFEDMVLGEISPEEEDEMMNDVAMECIDYIPEDEF